MTLRQLKDAVNEAPDDLLDLDVKVGASQQQIIRRFGTHVAVGNADALEVVELGDKTVIFIHEKTDKDIPDPGPMFRRFMRRR